MPREVEIRREFRIKIIVFGVKRESKRGEAGITFHSLRGRINELHKFIKEGQKGWPDENIHRQLRERDIRGYSRLRIGTEESILDLAQG